MTWCFLMSMQLPNGILNYVDKWPLMDSSDLGFILLIYLMFVLRVGPGIMKLRAPFHMKGFLIFYNVIKVINSSILAYKFLSYILDKGLFPRKCEYDENTKYTIAVLYWKYMATKTLDLWDTIFFVLRKKSNQITFLHVYHHVFMVIITWLCLKYDPSDHWAFMAVMNCSIHSVMYTYYGFAALGPRFTKYLWWKKYITMMQLLQFVLVLAHVVVQTYTSECPMHKSTYWIGLANLTLFIFLFTDFYKRSYRAATSKDPVEFSCLTKHHVE